MPLVRIALREGTTPSYRAAVAKTVHRAMVDTINVPEQDIFQIVTEHPPAGLIYSADYLDIQRTDNILLIQISLNEGRTVEQKKQLYARMVELLAEVVGVQPADVFIGLIEVPKENWSFGDGIAQYAT